MSEPVTKMVSGVAKDLTPVNPETIEIFNQKGEHYAMKKAEIAKMIRAEIQKSTLSEEGKAIALSKVDELEDVSNEDATQITNERVDEYEEHYSGPIDEFACKALDAFDDYIFTPVGELMDRLELYCKQKAAEYEHLLNQADDERAYERGYQEGVEAAESAHEAEEDGFLAYLAQLSPSQRNTILKYLLDES